MKILIANNNMKLGGVQKSLCNLLREIDRQGQHEVTLLLFGPVGEYMDMLPKGVTCVTVNGPFRYFGLSQDDCRGLAKLKRSVWAVFCRAFGRPAAVKQMLPRQKMLPGEYDCAIAFQHNGGKNTLAGGVQEFVLERVNAAHKVAFVHGDYGQNGTNYPENDRLLARFDRVAACSDGCAAALKAVLPELSERIVTVRNCNDIAQIRSLAEEDPVAYDKDCLNMICVARLSATKGIDRAIRATAKAVESGFPAVLHIVGSGPEETRLRALSKELKIGERVHFYGARKNPYRYMKNADLFLLTSYHEAAPMVIDEAYILGVPILTVRTSSSEEMVTRRGCGWVCENNQQALDEMLPEILRGLTGRERIRDCTADNKEALGQLAEALKH